MTLRVGWAGLLLAAGAWPLSAAWAGTTAAAVIVAAAVLPVVLLAAVSRLRLSASLVAVALLALTGVAAFLMAGAGGGAPGPALRDAIPRLLTTARPAPATPDLLLPGVLAAALIGIWVGMRTLPEPKPGSRLMAAPAGGLALYTAGALLSAGSADPRGLVAGAMVVLAAGGGRGTDDAARGLGRAAAAGGHRPARTGRGGGAGGGTGRRRGLAAGPVRAA